MIAEKRSLSFQEHQKLQQIVWRKLKACTVLDQ
jgi:hypothetical protein